MTFEEITNNNALYFKTCQLREDAEGHALAVCYTAPQLVFDIVNFKQRQEEVHGSRKLSASEVARLYAESGIRFAASSEKRTSPRVIDACITVYDRLLSLSGMMPIVMACEETYLKESPFSSVWKMQALIDKAKSTSRLQWLVDILVDRLQSGALAPRDITMDAIRGRSKKVSMADVILFQMRGKK